jgi:hypothetical protein
VAFLVALVAATVIVAIGCCSATSFGSRIK